MPKIDCLAPALFQEQGLGMDLPHMLVQDIDRQSDIDHEGFTLPATELLDDDVVVMFSTLAS